MVSSTLSAVALLAAFLPTALAQTYTACNPLNQTGCPNMPALGANATFNFNETWNTDIWTKANQGTVERTDKGTYFKVARSGDSAQLKSKFYMLFGRLEIVLKAAPGVGIVSSAILQSECLDEIDWEFLGVNNTRTYTNYYGKGNMTDLTRGKDYESDATQDDFHNYTIDWTKDRIQWWMDGKMLRQLNEDEALGGKNYPQTPMNIRIGAWAGGDPAKNSKGTVEWAGGEVDFSKGPFSMVIQDVYAQDYTSAKEYSWADMDSSGDWEKVKVIEGKSEAIETIEQPHGVRNRFGALSKNAKIGIAVGVVGFFLIAGLLGLAYFIKQRRAGRREFLAYQAQQDKENADLLQYKQEATGPMRNGGYGRI
ncbi:glycoside hydrolase family 16 protein [Pleomassaria siparia CBS 279.74]|uniref:chitinase n=1 Tax=Pleomassaria siparia CBS 279.74 TaxID=1314801 RepID=A0A6G1KL19_9PLEO|nr:glycoside hydrolase family 16 protein [Pleomassaria siparia CBS 279.74]